MSSITIVLANASHHEYAIQVCALIETSAKQRGTGIAKHSPMYIKKKMSESQAILALDKGKLAGFCYIESWNNKKYAANSGLIVHPDYRGNGLAYEIKQLAFKRSQKLFPMAKLFGLTTSMPVMKINSKLGYLPVTYNELTSDEEFWQGCSSCVNYEILISKEKANCMCTAMVFDPKSKSTKKWDFFKKSKIYDRFMRLKKSKLIKKTTK